MTLRKLPTFKALEQPEGLHWDPPSDALARWAALPPLAKSDDPATISILEQIGADWWTGEGVTARSISRQLQAIGQRAVSVIMNSPGGDFFEGLAIYNLFAEHPAQVTMKVMGLAASAASVIAMAGDTVAMGRGSFMMIHNVWAVAIGNRHDMRSAADILEPFDAAAADIYAARSGQKVEAAAEMMDAETWIGAGEAVKQGFADEVSDGPAPVDTDTGAASAISAKRRLDAVLAEQGMPRSERRRLLRALTGGTQDAAPPATPSAGDDLAAALRSVTQTLQA